MSNTVHHTEELLPLVELVMSLGLTHEQQAALLDGFRRELDAQERRLRAELDAQPTGLGSRAGGRLLPLREAERRHLVAALEQTRGKIYGRDGAARLLELKPTTLQSKLKKQGINRLDAAGEDARVHGSGPPPASHADDAEAPSHDASNGARSHGVARPLSAPASVPAE
jgi:hypothetical protein